MGCICFFLREASHSRHLPSPKPFNKLLIRDSAPVPGVVVFLNVWKIFGSFKSISNLKWRAYLRAAYTNAGKVCRAAGAVKLGSRSKVFEGPLKDG